MLQMHHAARYPFVYVQTSEEERLVREERRAVPPDVQFFSWDIIQGFRALVNPNGDTTMWLWKTTQDDVLDPVGALAFLKEMPPESIVFMKDFHKFFEDIAVIRQAINLKELLKSSGIMVVFVTPIMNIPVELANDIQTVDFAMPDKDSLTRTLGTVAEDNEITLEAENETVLVDALRGVTIESAENIIAFTLVKNGGVLDYKTILDAKAALLKASGVLTYVKPQETMADVYGNEYMIEWLMKTMSHPLSKAVAVYGVPGCGKTLTGRVIANEMKRPLLWADFNAVRGKYQGDAEGRIDMLFKTAKAFGRPLVIGDEFDKSIAGSGSGDLDSGVGQRIVQKVLTELDEPTPEGPYYYFTLNSLDDFQTISGGALIRRMDVIFFVDLPTPEECIGISKIHSRKMGVEIPEDFNFEGYSGADIAKLAKNMAMLGCSVEDAAQFLIPSAEAIGPQIEMIRKKAKSICIAAGRPQVKYGYSTIRKVKLASA